MASYAHKVVSGEIAAGRLVRRACERHLRDLVDGPARGLQWDAAAAQRALAFFSHLNLAEGRPFALQPFQQFIVGSLYGWMGPDGYRRFRSAYIEIGKGNGKSPLAAGVGLYGLVADGEDSAEVYAAAAKKDQAMILFRDAVRIVDSTPALAKRLKKSGTFPGVWNLAYEAKGGFFRPISSEDSQSGPRPHVGLIDEVHEHRGPHVVDMMRAGTKARKQALVFEITNSGHDRTSVCWHHHEYSAQVVEGLVENDTWFAYVCQLDACEACRAEGKQVPTDGCKTCDDWRDEMVWPKANPGLDTILPRKYLRDRVQEAKGIPATEHVVRRLNFCVWTEVATRAIPMDAWVMCRALIDLTALRELACVAGLDIGSTSDFTAFVLAFLHDDTELVEVSADPAKPDAEKRTLIRRSYTLVPYFWLPERPVRRDERMMTTIDLWRRQGHVRTTPGDVVDYDQVLADIIDLVKDLQLGKLAVDRGFQGAQICTNLLNHFGSDVVCAFAQGIISMNAPFREFLELVKQGRLHHPGCPVMDWMAGNTAAESRGGLVKPSKDHSAEKIDGITAGVMAIGVAMQVPAGGGGSVYDNRGIEVV